MMIKYDGNKRPIPSGENSNSIMLYWKYLSDNQNILNKMGQ